MPRRNLIRQTIFPYHVVTRTNNKTWFQIPIFEVWDIFKESIIYAQKKAPVIIHAFTLMSNHYHLLLTTPDGNIERFMMLFNLMLSKLISKKSGVINQKFSNKYKWFIIDNKNYLLNVYRYIYQNPVKAQITNDCFSYPYSSLHLTRIEARLLNFKPHITYEKDKFWIEKSFGDEFDLILKKSLNKSHFTPSSKVSKFHMHLLQNPVP